MPIFRAPRFPLSTKGPIDRQEATRSCRSVSAQTYQVSRRRRSLGKDFERTLESSTAWAQPGLSRASHPDWKTGLPPASESIGSGRWGESRFLAESRRKAKIPRILLAADNFVNVLRQSCCVFDWSPIVQVHCPADAANASRTCWHSCRSINPVQAGVPRFVPDTASESRRCRTAVV